METSLKGHADVTHLTGELYFVNQYDGKLWSLAGILCLFVPPVGVFMAFYMASSCVMASDDDVETHLLEAETDA